jgi:ABC exporter DevB family membrane fusion protein
MRYKIALVIGSTLVLGALAWPKKDEKAAAAQSATSIAVPASLAGTLQVGASAGPFQQGTRVVTGLGIVEPADGEIDLAFPMLGVISNILVKEGDTVARGTIIAELINQDLKAKLAQAEATLSIKSADYDRAHKGSRPQEIARAQNDLRSEEATLKLLRLQAERRQKLVRKGSVSQEAADTADSALKAGQERRDSAEQALSLLREGERSETIAAAAAKTDLARHQMEEAQATLDKSYLRAPADGTILRLYREAGEAVSTQPASPIVQLGDLTRLVVRAQIDESDIASLRVGQSARITAPALDGHQVLGQVTRISPRLGAKTVSDGSPTEKRDARVLDVIITLDPDVKLPVSLRVDAFIDLDSPPLLSSAPGPIQLAGWLLRR